MQAHAALGSLFKIRLSADSVGKESTWLVEKVEVCEVLEAGCGPRTTFSCHGMRLTRNGQSGTVAMDLLPDSSRSVSSLGDGLRRSEDANGVEEGCGREDYEDKYSEDDDFGSDESEALNDREASATDDFDDSFPSEEEAESGDGE